MITLTSAAQQIITRTHRNYLQVQSWLGDQLLSADVPVDSASEEADRTSNVPERVTFTVPRRDRGVSWAPTTDDHPLAANGQRLIVRLGVGTGMTEPEWIQRGTFLVQDSKPDGDTVSVTAVGLLSLLDEARLVSPYQPSGTLVSTLRGLIEPALTVVVDGGLADRSVPSGVNFDEDRLGAVWELVSAWPADAMVDPLGFLRVFPVAMPSVAALSLTDGAGGTVVTAAGESTREGAYNAFVARGTAADGTQVQAVAYLTGGPRSYGGPFNPLPVPTYFESPLLTTVNQCALAAATLRDRAALDTGATYTVTCLPHPGLQVGDAVSLTTDDVTDLLCTVQRLTLPYNAGGGSMTFTAVSV